MQKYSVLLFDADGTLFDFDQAEDIALQNSFHRYHLTYNQRIRKIYRQINVEAWAAFERGDLSKKELQVLRFAKTLEAIDQSAAGIDAAELNLRYLTELGKCGVLLPGALEACQTLSQSSKLYIITNGIEIAQRGRLENSPIQSYITEMFVSEQIGHAKPHTAYFDYVFSHVPVADKATVLVIGDSLIADIRGGFQAGVDTCWFNPNHLENTEKVQPTYEIHALAELLPMLMP